nr:MAG TPA: hypothetical protein [Caudoviricetes sp.]
MIRIFVYVLYITRYVYRLHYSICLYYVLFVFGVRPFRIKDYDLGLAFGL